MVGAKAGEALQNPSTREGTREARWGRAARGRASALQGSRADNAGDPSFALRPMALRREAGGALPPLVP